MADMNSTLGAFVPTVVSPATSNWGAQVPALIVNPEAGLGDLLGWCALEAAELNQLADMMTRTRSGEQSEADDLAARFQHRLAPLAQMLDSAATIAGDARNVKGVQHG